MVGPTNNVYHPKCCIRCGYTDYTGAYTSSTYYEGTAESLIRDSFYSYVSVTRTEIAPIIEIILKPEEVFYITLFLILLELHLILEFFAYLIRAPPLHVLINFIKEIYNANKSYSFLMCFLQFYSRSCFNRNYE